MIVELDTRRLGSLGEVREFLEGSGSVRFKAPTGADRRRWIGQTLRQFHYRSLGRADKGLVRSLIIKASGYSRAQATRLIGQWREDGQIRDRRGPPKQPFKRRFSRADVALLAKLDRLHGQLSGPATKKLAERAAAVFGQAEYAQLATISVSHLYNLRASKGYREQRGHYTRTRPTQTTIGERRRPQPNGEPGYLRVDSVHQGDFDGVKGVYLINLVDAVTQYEYVATVARISELFLIPVLRSALDAFPFRIRGFHTDNGSEYINHQVAQMLRKLHIEFTKCRARRSTDNALVESKNGGVVRKHLGYSHIPANYAEQVDAFTRDVLTPYLNYHRPCFFAETVIDSKGRQRRRYRYELMETPYEKLKSIPDAARFLKPGLSFAQLDIQAHAQSDSEAAEQLNLARDELFKQIQPKSAA
jgi:transposase InsO family protein